MDNSLAKELKDAGFPQNGKSCDTHSDINDSTLVERFVRPTLSELIEACPRRVQALSRIQNACFAFYCRSEQFCSDAPM
jgi:hypothetical protein